jgi:iron complex transport system substrate-binding protein
MLPLFSRRRFTLGLLATFALLLPRGAAAPVWAQQPATPAFPITITDDAGVSSTFAVAPQRIVSLNPGLTEITFALGAGSRLVAVDTYSDYPPEAKDVQPRLNTYPTPSAETIVGLKPDLVLSLAERDEDLAPIRRQGIPVLKLFPRDFDAAVQTILTLGRLYGTSELAMTIGSDMLARRDAVTAAVADAPRPRVYEELDASEPDKPFVAGPNGFYGQLVDLAGGANIFGDVNGDVAQVGAETIVERDPEVIVLTDADLPFNPQTPEMVAARPAPDRRPGEPCQTDPSRSLPRRRGVRSTLSLWQRAGVRATSKPRGCLPPMGSPHPRSARFNPLPEGEAVGSP